MNSPLTSTTFPQIPFSSSQRVDPNVFPTTPTLTIPAMREQIHSSPQSPFENGHLRPYNPPCSAPTHPVPHPRRPSKGRSREIKGLCCFFYISSHSVLFVYRCFSFACSRWSLIYPFFSTPGTRNASKSPINNTYIPPSPASLPHVMRSLSSYLLRPPDPTISDANEDDSPPKLGEDWMHREFVR